MAKQTKQTKEAGPSEDTAKKVEAAKQEQEQAANAEAAKSTDQRQGEANAASDQASGGSEDTRGPTGDGEPLRPMGAVDHDEPVTDETLKRDEDRLRAAEETMQEMESSAGQAGDLAKGALDADGGPDAIALFEAAVAATFSDRYRRNSALTALARHYQVHQGEIKAIQGRLDQRERRREEDRERRDEEGKKEKA